MSTGPVLTSQFLRTDFPWSFRAAVLGRLGYLNIFNPMYSEGYMEIDLSERDQRVVAEVRMAWAIVCSQLQVLVDLSMKEPGENWLG